MRVRFGMALVISVALSSSLHALSLTGTGTSTTLSGSLGTVDVISRSDNPTLDGALTSGGIVPSGLGLGVTRVQYDLLNQAGNASIFSFRVDYPVGTNVVSAANPGAFRRADGTLQTYWAGSNYSTLFDSGFGLYTADRDNHGSEWVIDYQPDHVTWSHIGNGFFPDTATGITDVGSALPTFSIEFKQGTPLGLQPGVAMGSPTAALTATGRVISAVPEPTSCLLAIGSLLLAAASRRS